MRTQWLIALCSFLAGSLWLPRQLLKFWKPARLRQPVGLGLNVAINLPSALNVLWNFPIFVLWYGIKCNFSAWLTGRRKCTQNSFAVKHWACLSSWVGRGYVPSWHLTLSWKQTRFSTDVYWIRTYCPEPRTDKTSDGYKHAIPHPSGLHTLWVLNWDFVKQWINEWKQILLQLGSPFWSWYWLSADSLPTILSRATNIH